MELKARGSENRHIPVRQSVKRSNDIMGEARCMPRMMICLVGNGASFGSGGIMATVIRLSWRRRGGLSKSHIRKELNQGFTVVEKRESVSLSRR